MKAEDILLLGLKRRVTALSRADGSTLWQTDLPEGSSSSFISITSDARQVFAICSGVLHCLDLFSGAILWTNRLKGLGFGIASLCLPGQSAVGQAAAAARHAADASSTTAITSSTAATS